MAASKPEKDASLTRSRLTLLGLVFIFVSPILVAWVYTAGFIDIPALGRTNRGTVVNPALSLRDVADAGPLFELAKLQPGEWALTYVAPGECGQTCVEILARLKTIRSLLGYNGQRVRALVVADGSASADPAHILSHPTLAKYMLDRLQEAGAQSAQGQIVLIDWRQQVAIRFAPDVAPIDIKKDIKKLLRASQIR